MYLLSYLLQQAHRMMMAAVVAACLSGASSAALVGLISRQLTSKTPITPRTIGYFVGLIITVMITDLLAKWLLTRLSAQTTYALRLRLAKRILNTPLRQLEIIGNPTLLAALGEDIRTIALALNQLPNVCIGLTIIVACSAYLTWLSPTSFAVLALLALPTLLIHYYLHRRAKIIMRAMLASRDQRDIHFAALTQGAKELQLNQRRRLAFGTHLLEPILRQLQEQGIKTRMSHAFAQTWSQSIYFIFILAILLLGSRVGIELSILTTYAVTALYMKNSINQLLLAIPTWTEATVTLQKLENLRLAADQKETPEKTWDEARNDFVMTPHFCLRLSAITHAYATDISSEPFTLGPMDLHFTAGELVFITGANGSGKTTLLKVLAGLYTPEGGTICLNQMAVTEQNRQNYRELFSVVFSDFYLFEHLLGMEESTINEQTSYYLHKLQLQSKVTINQGRLSTLDLSQGQRKRLALLTAYLEDRPIYLFDEWAANQDPLFKEIFYCELLPELVARGKLVIAITHDDRYFSLANRILHLENGQLIEKERSLNPILKSLQQYT